LTLRDLCDIAYVVQVRQADAVAIDLAAAMVADGMTYLESLSFLDGARADFDAALCAAPPPPSKAELLRRELGVA
jgi:hypothetical protein